MMHKHFDIVSYITPMHHSVQSYLAIFYGTISPAPFLWGLATVGVGALLINVLIVTFLHKSVPIEPTEKNDNILDSKEITV